MGKCGQGAREEGTCLTRGTKVGVGRPCLWRKGKIPHSSPHFSHFITLFHTPHTFPPCGGGPYSWGSRVVRGTKVGVGRPCIWKEGNVSHSSPHFSHFITLFHTPHSFPPCGGGPYSWRYMGYPLVRRDGMHVVALEKKV